MKMNRQTILALCSILLAVAVPLGIALKASNDLKSNPIVKISMQGYDPRDLLYGHYLMFQYDWNFAKASLPACTGKNCCLCLDDGATDPEVKIMECAAAKQDVTCKHTIKGDAWGGQNFSGPATRFYVDETKALPLEKFFREEFENIKFHMGLSIFPSGKAQIENLYIDGQPYLDYMAQHPEKFDIQDEAVSGSALDEPAESQPLEPVVQP
jgi:hypothetical protein